MTGSAIRTAGFVLLALAAAAGAWALLRTDGGDPAAERASGVAQRRPPTLIASLPLAGSLGTIEPGFGSAWLDDRARGELIRVDPETGKILARLRVDGRVALTAGAGAMWALQRGDAFNNALGGPLLRIDPRTNRVVDEIVLQDPPARYVPTFGVLAHPRAVWIWGPRTLLHLDRRRGRIDRTVDVDADLGEVTGAVVLGEVLMLATGDGRLLRLDAVSGRRLATTRTGLGAATLTAGGKDTLLATIGGTLAYVSASTGKVLWRRELGYRVNGVAELDGIVWAEASPPRRPRDILVGLDPRTGRDVSRNDVEELGTSGMALLGRRLWVTTVGGRVLVVEP